MENKQLVVIKDQTVVLISIITAVCLLGNSMLYVTLPIYFQEVGLKSLWEVGLLLSVNRFVRLPLNAIIGWLYSKTTIRFGFILAVSFAAIATLGYGIFTGFWMWLLLRIFWGAAWSLLKLGGFLTVLVEAEKDQRGHLMGKYNGLHRLGDFFGMLMGGILAGLLGFRQTLFIFGLIIALTIPIAIIFVPNYSASHHAKTESQELKNIHFSFSITRVILGGLVISMLFEGVMASTLSLLLNERYQEGIWIFNFTITVAAMSGFLQGIRWLWEPFLAPFIGRRSDKMASRQMLFIPFLILGALGFFIVPLKLPLFLLIVVILILMLTATALVTLSDSLASDIARQSSSVRIMTIYTIALDFGAALGPVIGYQLVILSSGLLYTYLLGSILLFIVLLLWAVPLINKKSLPFNV
ncbi:MAG: MFS transporter [Clostridia bacterium]|nr:MFS transporter [Clostridia bacterium]